MTHEEGLLVERPSPPSHQEQEGHSISGNRKHGRQSTGVHDDWSAVTIRRQQHSGRPHEMDFPVRLWSSHITVPTVFLGQLGRQTQWSWSGPQVGHDSSFWVAHRSSCGHVTRLADRAQDDRPAEINHRQNHRVSQVMWNNVQRSDWCSNRVRTRW